MSSSTLPDSVIREPVKTEMDASARKELLAGAVHSRFAQGWRMEGSSTDNSTVLIKGKKVNHTLHLLITFFTLGTWAPVWIALAIFGGEKREIAQVDEYGNVGFQKL